MTQIIYTREELETKLKHLEIKLERVFKLAEDIRRSVDALWWHLYQERLATGDELRKLDELQRELVDFIYDLVDAIIARELKLDVDIDKYEKQYGIKFYEGDEHFVGVALVKENNEVKPVVVWTDYLTVGYTEGEREQ
jgi:Mg2+ and Co2+ transporter CorA